MSKDSDITVWIADDDASIRWVLEKSLREEGMRTVSFESADKLLESLKDRQPDVVIADVHMPGTSGLELVAEVASMAPDLPVIIITAHSDLDTTVNAYQSGAFEYLPKPFDIDIAVELVQRAASQRMLSSEEEESIEFAGFIGQAPVMQDVFRAIGRVSGSGMTVLITGESGTGKELIAQSLHQHSQRKKQPFVALNTSAIPGELLESELFGHEKGSFTGADRRRIGRFEQANNGTLFLDEIGDMPLELQTRLLRVLAENEFYRVGGQQAISVDVRIIAATNQNLQARVADGSFREDLYHRLNVIEIHSPPLRERRQDISLLLDHYLKVAAQEMNVPPKKLSRRAATLLNNFRWPGNVRQLVNVCRRLSALAPGREIREQDIPADMGGGFLRQGQVEDWTAHLARWASQRLVDSNSQVLKEALPDFEKTLIEVVLSHTGGHRQKAAEKLGWGRNTLTRKINELKIETNDIEPGRSS